MFLPQVEGQTGTSDWQGAFAGKAYESVIIGIYAQSKRLQAVRIEHGDSGMAKRILGCDPRETDVLQGSYRSKNKEVHATRRGRTDVSRDLGH